jgi:hypothetical protein
MHLILLNKSFDNIKYFTKKLNLKDNFENILDNEDLNNDNNKIRSQTFVVKNTKHNCPRYAIIEANTVVKDLITKIFFIIKNKKEEVNQVL